MEQAYKKYRPIIQEAEAIYEAFGYDIRKLQILGGAGYGVAFLLPDETRVLKITTSDLEYNAVRELIASGLYNEPGIANINPASLEVLKRDPIDNYVTLSGYILERLIPLSQKERSLYHSIITDLSYELIELYHTYLFAPLEQKTEAIERVTAYFMHFISQNRILETDPELENMLFFLYQAMETGLFLWDIGGNMGWRIGPDGDPLRNDGVVLFDLQVFS